MNKRFRYLRYLAVRVVSTLVMLLTLIHISRVLVEVEHVKADVINSARKSAKEIEQALEAKDIFQMNEILWSFKKDGVSWITFKSAEFLSINEGFLFIGGKDPEPFLSTDITENISNRGLNLGSIMFEISPVMLSLSLLKSNWIVYAVLCLVLCLIFLLMFGEIWWTLRHVESELESISTISKTPEKIFSDKALTGRKNSSPLREIYVAHLSKVIDTVSKIKSVEKELSLLKVRADLAAEIAHDIRSPLSALNLSVSKISAGSSEAIEIARMATSRINEIAEGLLNQRKCSNNISGVEVSAHKIDLKKLCSALIEERKIEFQEDGKINLIEDFSDACVIETRISENEIYRILLNLINNARHAIKNSGSITLSCRIYPAQTEISVTDDGEGMDQETIVMLGTNSFTRGKEGTANGHGIGIGYVKKTLISVGGSLSFISCPGKGTVATVKLSTERSGV